jgi:imidazole glycerol-phosphate synthase subunit HisH
MGRVGVIDYGMGNLRSVEKGLEKVGVDVAICDRADELDGFDGLVLPGVGAFGDAMVNLRDRGMIEPLHDFVKSGRHLLGICLGMQLLLSSSDEHGRFDGLGIIPGEVPRLPGSVKVPHMGWNVLRIKRDVPLFAGIEDGSRFYFVHSFYCAPADDTCTIGTTQYGLDFTSAVGRDNVWGLQFHPEKSSSLGLRMLHNFGVMVSGRTGGEAV